VNSEIAEIRKAIAQNPPTEGSFEDRRARWEPLFRKMCPIPTGTLVASIAAGGPRGEWVTAVGMSTTEPRILFYIHGGGFTAGTTAAYRGLSSHLGAATGCRVLAVDYRWAPEDPFPAALDLARRRRRRCAAQGGARRRLRRRQPRGCDVARAQARGRCVHVGEHGPPQRLGASQHGMRPRASWW
jgi:epsilon-lactone hydrolase